MTEAVYQMGSCGSTQQYPYRFCVSDLTVDLRVQREIDPSKLKAIMENWQPLAVGAITVSVRDSGQFHVIDGAHRVEATRQIKGRDAEVDGVAIEGLSVYDEAELFRHYNRQKPATKLELFKVRLIEGEARAHQIKDAIAESGWSVGKGSGQIHAVAALDSIYTQGEKEEDGYGYDLVRNTVAVLTDGWGNTAPGVVHDLMLRGLASFLVATRSYDVDLTWLAKSMRKSHYPGPNQFIRSVKQHTQSTGRDSKQIIRAWLHHMYNNGKRGKKLPDLPGLI